MSESVDKTPLLAVHLQQVSGLLHGERCEVRRQCADELLALVEQSEIGLLGTGTPNPEFCVKLRALSRRWKHGEDR